jgi:acetyl-CoA/propionyl-CoA carboxylase biotin carboxyl carrier protein
VQPGDKVGLGDPLCVLEAMKMENEVVAPKGGTIAEVRVVPGSTVDKGAVLFLIE